MVFAASQGGVENELESYLDSRTVGSGAGRNFCVPAGYGNNAENGKRINQITEKGILL